MRTSPHVAFFGKASFKTELKFKVKTSMSRGSAAETLALPTPRLSTNDEKRLTRTAQAEPTIDPEVTYLSRERRE